MPTDSPAPVEALTMEGYDDGWEDRPSGARTGMIVAGVAGAVLVVGGFLLAVGGYLRDKQQRPEHGLEGRSWGRW